MAGIQLVWFRNDLRSRDQVALAEAARAGQVVGVYCFCPGQLRRHDVGGNRVAFLMRCLASLRDELDELNIPLRIVRAPYFEDLPRRLVEVAREVGAETVWFNAEYPLNERRRDRAVTAALEAGGYAVRCCTDQVIQAPGTVTTNEGEPYVVFSAFRRRWLRQLDPDAARPLGRPPRQRRPEVETNALPGVPGEFEPEVDPELWPGGEGEAMRRLEDFLDGPVHRYHEDRDFPAVDGTSTLSPYLSVGAISPRTCLDGVMRVNDGRIADGDAGAVGWATEIVWREFYRHVIAAYDHVSRGEAFRREYDAVPWREDEAAFAAWREGRTGFPLVDAAMRQLRGIGWMHNRLRMTVAMFLSKNLLLDWRLGERHFMQLLVDGDFASNNGGWQWSASTGTDAAPYFRIFNPVRQSERFDPEGRFIRHWVPELAEVEGKAIHQPWRRGGVADYPEPIVDAKATRERAIEAFRML